MTKFTEAEFIETWIKCGGSPSKVSKITGLNERSLMRRRNNIQLKLGITLPSSINSTSGRPKEYVDKIGKRINLSVVDGEVFAFSDCHYWPGDKPIAHTALVALIKKRKPRVVICNGDALDMASVSRHPPIGWARVPDVADELEYCKQMLGEIEQACPPNTKLCYNIGNHDLRFEARLANNAPQYVRVEGTTLQEQFPAWNFAWATHINDDVVCKHRLKGGVHATWGNTLHGGKTLVTSHLHRLAITPLTDYNGRRYGVDTGCIADFGPETQTFDYAEDAPLNWGSGFAVLTFKNKKLLPPELVEVQDSVAYFRGESILNGAT